MSRVLLGMWPTFLIHLTHSLPHGLVSSAVLFIDHALCSQCLSLTSHSPFVNAMPGFSFPFTNKREISFQCDS